MIQRSPTQVVKRFLTLKTDRIHALPVAVLMPHSSCNCRCLMCDIWKGNANPRQLTAADVHGLLDSFERLGTRWVVMSGGEALMNRNLFALCDMLKARGLKITILSTGLLLKKFAAPVVEKADEVIVSLDGSEPVHDAIRRVPRAFRKLADGVAAVKALDPSFRITSRCVVQRLNFRDWPNIIDAAHDIGLDGISFLAADVSTDAFNRAEPWGSERSEEVKPRPEELPELAEVLRRLFRDHAADFSNGYIAESPRKLWRIYEYYAALEGLGDFPPVRCNAPWVSAVVESDGSVRPCFFHRPMGSIRETSLEALLNSATEVAFRRNLDMNSNPVCRKCVCTLNLRPWSSVGA